WMLPTPWWYFGGDGVVRCRGCDAVASAAHVGRTACPACRFDGASPGAFGGPAIRRDADRRSSGGAPGWQAFDTAGARCCGACAAAVTEEEAHLPTCPWCAFDGERSLLDAAEPGAAVPAWAQ